MPEEVKLSSYAPAKDYKSDYCSSADDSHPESSIYADHSDREMSRSETSSCSDESSCYKQNGHETIEIIPTRTIKTSIPKPAANPLQFVKIGPCDLYRSAQKQIQKVSEVKTPKKEVKDEVAMDWQSNLDSWKCNRRKQQEHIIERVVEVKKLELEEHDRNRKRTKTFNEMMEERTSKGRKASLPVYLEDDNDDLSDLGLSTNMKISRNESSPIPEENDEENDDQVCGADRKHNGHDGSDRAQMGNCEVTCENGVSKSKKCASSSAGLRKYGRRASATKIEEKLTELERIKNRSVSSTDLTESNKKSINLPKVNISQRKEMFEKFSDSNESNKNRRLSDEMPPVRSIKERLSSLGKTIEETTTTMTTTSTTTVTVQPIQTKSLLPVPEVSVKERLSSINRKMNEHNNTGVPIPPEKCGSRTKMSPPLEPESNDKPKEYATYETRPLCKPVEELSRREYSSSGRSSSSEDYDHVHHQTNHFHHRSLDSLQGHDSPNGFCFERVQSLEYIDCCSNYPASVLSGDTDREDSGIHTADVSSSVSQADDFDLHADTSMDVDVKAAQNATTTLISDDTKVVDKSSQNDYCFVSQEAGQGSLDDVHDDHVDVTAVFGCEDRRDNVDASLMEEEEEEERGGEASVTSETNSNSPPVVAEERLPVVEPNQKLDAAIEETIELSHDQNQNAKEQLNEDDTLTSSRLNDNGVCDSDVESPVDDSWDMDCKIVEQDDNLNNVEEDDSVAEEASPASSNVKNLDSSEDAMQNFANIEDECLSGTECGVNSSQHFDYIYAMNNKFHEGNQCNFTESNQLFAFEPLSVAAEPPKEKPPPPPSIDNSDEEVTIMENSKGLRRMDSTKRIKKQLRQKRSSFLGIEGYDDDSYLEPELEAVKPPPDMTTFLQEERRLEQLLYRQSICSESDSTLGESRDSGVELDKNHNEDNLWISERACSRQDSEIYANTSITSEEEEIIKKEREILEILEMEERRNYESGSKNECNNINEKLVLKLKELENRKNDDANWNQENELSDLENRNNRPLVEPIYENCDVSLKGHTHHQMHELSGQSPNALLLQQQWAGRPLQDIGQKDMLVDPVDENHQKTRLDYRDSTSNVPEESRTVPVNHHFKQPPPVPMNKPTHFKEQPAANNKLSSPQQMSKQTLQALSAVPRSKITDSWVQTKKKPRQEAYNYQHWLIQEAEHRRITEYQERQSKESTTATTTTTTTHNYMNVHPEFSEPTGLLADAVQQQQQQQQSPPSNRTATYSHPPQMLPYRNQNQTYSNTNSNECKSQTKMQYCNSNNNSNSSSSSSSNSSSSKPLPDSVIQTLTQRVQNRFGITDGAKQRRQRESYSNTTKQQQEKILSVSGKKKCSHCGEELGRGAAMIIESLRLFYHIDCFRCCVCCVQLGDGLMGTDVRVRNSKLHCHSCYSNDEGVKFSCV